MIVGERVIEEETVTLPHPDRYPRRDARRHPSPNSRSNLPTVLEIAVVVGHAGEGGEHGVEVEIGREREIGHGESMPGLGGSGEQK